VQKGRRWGWTLGRAHCIVALTVSLTAARTAQLLRSIALTLQPLTSSGLHARPLLEPLLARSWMHCIQASCL
jgi:hypothetical protein